MWWGLGYLFGTVGLWWIAERRQSHQAVKGTVLLLVWAALERLIYIQGESELWQTQAITCIWMLIVILAYQRTERPPLYGRLLGCGISVILWTAMQHYVSADPWTFKAGKNLAYIAGMLSVVLEMRRKPAPC